MSPQKELDFWNLISGNIQMGRMADMDKDQLRSLFYSVVESTTLENKKQKFENLLNRIFEIPEENFNIFAMAFRQAGEHHLATNYSDEAAEAIIRALGNNL